MSTVETVNNVPKKPLVLTSLEKEKCIRDHFCRAAILHTALLLTVEQVILTTCNGGLRGGRGEQEALE